MSAKLNVSTTYVVRLSLLGLAAWLAGIGSVAGAESAFPLSRCFIRVPFDVDTDDGESVKVNSNNVLQFGHNGVDMNGLPAIAWGGDPQIPPVGYPLVAAAPGIVRHITDQNFGCCRGCSACNNKIWVEHPSGEWTVYFHIAQNSAQVNEGQNVSQGAPLVSEGDVGAVCGCGGVQNRPTAGCEVDNSTGTAGCGEDVCPFCAVHLHMGMFYGHDDSADPSDPGGSDFKGQVIPVVCGIDNGIFEVTEEYAGGNSDGDVANCNVNDCDPTESLGTGGNPVVVDAPSIRIEQASMSIVAEEYIIDDDDFGAVCDDSDDCTTPAFCSGGVCRERGASVAFRAGEKITLKPGFHARSGSYFRADIAPCNSCPGL